jgi:hypothetical protein
MCEVYTVVQVERRIDENDMMFVQLRDAIDVDKTLSRQAGPLNFSLLPQKQRGATALSCERYLAATGTVVPPCSAFFHSNGCSPAPNAAATRLAKLFWRSPAHARPQQLWEREEDNLLKHGIVQIVLAARRLEAVSDFKARMAALQGEGDALEEQRRALVEEIRDSRSHLGLLEAGATGSSEAVVLREADSFSLQRWHAVSYHVPGRCAAPHSETQVTQFDSGHMHVCYFCECGVRSEGHAQVVLNRAARSETPLSGEPLDCTLQDALNAESWQRS